MLTTPYLFHLHNSTQMSFWKFISSSLDIILMGWWTQVDIFALHKPLGSQETPWAKSFCWWPGGGQVTWDWEIRCFLPGMSTLSKIRESQKTAGVHSSSKALTGSPLLLEDHFSAFLSSSWAFQSCLDSFLFPNLAAAINSLRPQYPQLEPISVAFYQRALIHWCTILSKVPTTTHPASWAL